MQPVQQQHDALVSSPPLLTVREVAEHLRSSTKFVYRLCEQGQLEFHKVGRNVRIPQTALKQYLARVLKCGDSPTSKPKRSRLKSKHF